MAAGPTTPAATANHSWGPASPQPPVAITSAPSTVAATVCETTTTVRAGTRRVSNPPPKSASPHRKLVARAKTAVMTYLAVQCGGRWSPAQRSALQWTPPFRILDGWNSDGPRPPHAVPRAQPEALAHRAGL